MVAFSVPTENTRLETEWSKLPSGNTASSGLRRLEQHSVPSKMCMSSEFLWKNDPRNAHTGIPRDVSAKSWATSRSRHKCVATYTVVFFSMQVGDHSTSELMLFSEWSDKASCFSKDGSLLVSLLCFFPCDVSFSRHLDLITMHAAPCANVSCPTPKKPNNQVRGGHACGEREEFEERSHVWSRHSQTGETWSHRPNKYGETRMWRRIHKAFACWHQKNWIRSNRYGGDPYWWIRKNKHKIGFRVTRIVTCSCERKQKISAFKSSSRRSKVIFIEKHFMPTRSRTTSTTHSAKIRRRWSANWVMWNCSRCAKQFHKYNAENSFFIGIKELCLALADNAWMTSNPEESFHKLRLDALSFRITW